MLKKLLHFFKKDYQTLNKIEVYKNNLIHNYQHLSSFKLQIAPVVKSNGYGHGIINVAKILATSDVEHKIPFFCVDSLFEGYQLLNSGIKNNILIMGYTNPENLKVKKLPFFYAVYDLDFAKAVNKYQPHTKIHIFVDTGMHREGIQIKNLPMFLTELKKLPNIKIEGLMSHLASSENDKDPLFLSQLKQFKKAQDILKKFHIKPKWFHIGATGSITNPKTRPFIAKVSNLARAGLSLYGISYSSFEKNLKPALRLTTKIAQIKQVKKGEKIGYDGSYLVKKDMLIGILPIGYYDGIDRRLSNKGVFLINGVECPILGKVSMNINVIDLSKVKNPKVGDEVVVYSNNPEDKNSLQMSAKLCNTIAYDLLVNLAESTKRTVV